jgi:hypothetical protein
VSKLPLDVSIEISCIAYKWKAPEH